MLVAGEEICCQRKTLGDVLSFDDVTTLSWETLGLLSIEQNRLFHPIDEIAAALTDARHRGGTGAKEKNEMLGKKNLKGGTAVGLKVGKDVLSKYVKKRS